jgi:membrane associated rhomboid family serine protease/Zn-finger nucleic acid-binding protein
LRQIAFKSAVIDICPDCRGIWFDSGEFVDFVSALGETQKVPNVPAPLFQPRNVETPEKLDEAKRLCPRCNLTMHKFNYAYDSNIMLDRCPACNGIWTDSGEAQRAARHIKSNPEVTGLGKALVQRNPALQELNDLAEFGETFRRLILVPKIILPLSDDLQRRSFPAVTLSIIASCTLLSISQLFSREFSTRLIDTFGFIPHRFLHVSLITSIFLHAGLLHLAGNMLFLWVFGDSVENRFGTKKYLLFYLLSGLAGSISHAAFAHDPFVPAVGASGAISGVLGAYIFLFPHARLKMLFWIRVIHVPAWFYLGFWFLLQLQYGLLSTAGLYSNVGWFAHIGGFAFGVTFAYFEKSGTFAKTPVGS